MKKSYEPEAFAVASLLLGVFALLFLMLGVAIQSKMATDPTPVEHQQYLTTGYYYEGYVIRDDGHIWDYESYLVEPNSHVWVKFDDNGTPEEITDDYIICMVFDYTKGVN